MSLLRWIHTCCLMIASLSALAFGSPDLPLLQHAREATGVYVVENRDMVQVRKKLMHASTIPYTCLTQRKGLENPRIEHFFRVSTLFRQADTLTDTDLINGNTYIFYIEKYEQYISFPGSCIVSIPAAYTTDFESQVTRMMQLTDANNDEGLWELLFEQALHPCPYIADNAKFTLSKIGVSSSCENALGEPTNEHPDSALLALNAFPRSCIPSLITLLDTDQLIISTSTFYGDMEAHGVLYLALWQRVKGAGFATARMAQYYLTVAQNQYESRYEMNPRGGPSRTNTIGISLAADVFRYPDSASTGQKEAALALLDVLAYWPTTAPNLT